MRPLEELPEVERALLGAPPAAVNDAIARATSNGAAGAALLFAEGALLLRSGSLEAASDKLDEAAKAFEARGDREAIELAAIEAHTARVRRGMRDLATRAKSELLELEASGATDRVRVAALVVRGTAERVLGEAARAHEAFLAALERSARLPDLRTQALNSLGTLYVVTGALAAAVPNLERAAELCHARGDVVGEAIAMGQLGAASLGLGDLVAARRYLSRQEFLAKSVDDSFGAARALVWLAEVALSLGSPSDAIEIATRGRGVAEAAGLTTWGAYANRIIGRAMRERGEAGAPVTEAALAVFHGQRLPLGEALCLWDLGVAGEGADHARLSKALGIFASLGLVDRVSEVLLDLRRIGTSPRGAAPDVDVLLSAVGLSGRRSEAVESELVHDDPIGLAKATAARTSTKRNVARLALLAISPPGLVVLAAAGVVDPLALLADRGFEGTLLGQMGDLSLFAWHVSTARDAVAADAARVVAVAAAARGAFEIARGAYVEAPGHGGGTGAKVHGLAVAPLVARALSAPGIEAAPEWAHGDASEP